MSSIQKVHVEVVKPERANNAAQIEAYIAEMVDRRVAQIMARQDLAVFQPYFESKEFANAIRRIQTAPAWHRHRIYFERFGCTDCKTRQHIHGALGYCIRCYRRKGQRLAQITKELEKKCQRVEDLIEQERLAYQAYIDAGGKTGNDLMALPTPSARPIVKKNGAPKMKPQIIAGDPGARVRQLRELVGISQVDLAAEAGVDPSTIVAFEKGHNRALPSHRAAIRRVLVEKLVQAFWPE